MAKFTKPGLYEMRGGDLFYCAADSTIPDAITLRESAGAQIKIDVAPEVFDQMAVRYFEPVA